MKTSASVRATEIIFLLLLLLCIISSHASAPSVEPFGLEGKTITALATSPSDPYFPPLLCAGTDSSGVYLRNLAKPDSSWVYMGLKGKRITAVCVYWSGAGPGEFLDILAGTKPTFNQGDSTFIYCRLIYPWVDTGWIVCDNGIDAYHTHEIRSIDGFFYGGHDPVQPVFACGNGRVLKIFGFPIGESWTEMWSMDLATTNIIQVVQPVVPFLGPVWAGGEIDSSTPYLIKSIDYGDTWQIFYPSIGGDNACYSIAVHPEYPETVYAGMKGTIIKTTNEGAIWESTGLQDTSVYFYGLVIDPSNPEHLYAGGASNENAFAMYETFNGGEEWQSIPPSGNLKGISILAIDPQQSEVIYIGTLGTGVFRYCHEVGIELNEEKASLTHALYQNYPNPFNAETQFKFSLPKETYVSIRIYDVRGRLIKALVNAKLEAGYHTVNWEPDGLPTGVYFCRIEIGNYADTKKLVLLK